MVHENEIVMLLLGIGGLVFTFQYRQRIKRLSAWKWLVSSFYILLFGWITTIFEGFWLPNFFNFIEHTSYALSAVLLVIWCLKVSSISHKAGKKTPTA